MWNYLVKILEVLLNISKEIIKTNHLIEKNNYLTEKTNCLLEKILTGPPNPVKLFLIFKFKNKQMSTIKIGQLLEGNLELDDQATGQKISDAVFSGEEVTSSDETIATVVVNDSDPSLIDVTGVAPGSFTVHVKTNVSYTDSNGDPATSTVEADSDTITVTTEADGVTLKVNFPSA